MKSIVKFINESNAWDKCVAHIRKWKNVEDIYNEWSKFSVEEQLEMLAEANFIGFVMQDEIDNECILSLIRSTSKNDICGYLDDELYNRHEGYNTDDTNHYVVKYKGQKPIHTEDAFEEKKKLPRTNIEWICCNQGLTAECCFYANQKAKEEMIDYMGLIEFTQKEIKRIEVGDFDSWC